MVGLLKTVFQLESCNEREHLEDLGIDDKIL